MRTSACLFATVICVSSALGVVAATGEHRPIPAQITASRTVFFDDRTGAPRVGEKALAEVKKWGRFRIVTDRSQADLLLLLSSDPYKGGYVVLASGQTGTVKDGGIETDPIPNFNKQAPVRNAYLTLIDPKTGATLWTASHPWGGLLTGKDSAGERLVKKLEKEITK